MDPLITANSYFEQCSYSYVSKQKLYMLQSWLQRKNYSYMEQ
jgi:hypothetical protein